MSTELLEAAGEFVNAWACIEKYGVAGWIAMRGDGFTPDELLEEALAVFNGELQRLEFEEDVRRAMDDAKERDRKG
jgi:hypothetical protein